MSDLRDLLIDLRIELRHLKPDFQKTPMRHRLDEAVSMLGRLPDATLEGLLRNAKPVAQTPPAAVDPETLALRDTVAELGDTHPRLFALIQRNLDVRMGRAPPPEPEAIAEPVEDLAPPVQAASEPEVAAPPVVAEPDDGAPSESLLRAVAEGLRPLTEAQREWCMGEAMVLLGFQMSPQELLSRGDQTLARVILTGEIVH